MCEERRKSRLRGTEWRNLCLEDGAVLLGHERGEVRVECDAELIVVKRLVIHLSGIADCLHEDRMLYLRRHCILLSINVVSEAAPLRKQVSTTTEYNGFVSGRSMSITS